VKAAAGGPTGNSLVTARARSRWAGRPAAQAVPASMSRIKIHDLAAAAVVGSAGHGNNETLDHGCEPGTGG
jgi:hypothetical protein